MAEFEKKKHAQDEFNNGNKYVANDGVQPATINNLVENSLYTEAFAESLASTPDTTNVAQVGTPSVELVDNPSAGITGAKKFKFSNLKGEQGHGYFRVTTTLETTATSVASSYVQWGGATVALASDSIVDNNGNVFAVTTKTAATSPTIPIAYRTSIRGTAGADGDSVFIRYSASSNGSNMTATPAANTRYIGFYLGQNASNTASDYAWSQYVGKEISEVAIDEFSFVITYDDGTTSTVPLNTENCLVTYAVPSDEATAMTAYLAPNNADLNDYRGENYWGKTFYAGDSNTVQNTPVASIAFSLEVLRSGAFETVQRITMMAAGSTVYTRSVSDSTTTSADGTWTEWWEIADTNGTYPDMTVGNSTNATNAANATHATSADSATNATNDGGGNNIASTYATQTALTSGLAGKANTSGSYPALSVGTATNATNATNINTGAKNNSPWSNSSVFLSSRTINTDTPTNNDRIWAMSQLLGWAPSSNSNGLLFVSAMYFSGEGTERGRCVTGSVIVDPPTRTLTILTGIDKGFKWNFTEDATTTLKFTAFGGATLPAQVTITVLGFLDAGDHT